MCIVFKLLLLVQSIKVVLCVKLGYLYETGVDESSRLSLADDMVIILNLTNIKNIPEFYKVSTLMDGSQINSALKDFKLHGINHVFSPTIFEDMDQVNLALKNHDIVLWSTTPYISGKCHSNIVHYGSITKTIERCIFYSIYILL